MDPRQHRCASDRFDSGIADDNLVNCPPRAACIVKRSKSQSWRLQHERSCFHRLRL